MTLDPDLPGDNLHFAQERARPMPPPNSSHNRRREAVSGNARKVAARLGDFCGAFLKFAAVGLGAAIVQFLIFWFRR